MGARPPAFCVMAAPMRRTLRDAPSRRYLPRFEAAAKGSGGDAREGCQEGRARLLRRLDTSVILRWLQVVYKCEVVTFTADLGQGEELEPARRKAEMLGIKQILRGRSARNLHPRLRLPDVPRQRALRGQYLLGTSIARPLIAQRQIEIAEEPSAPMRWRMARPARATTRCASSCQLLRAEARHQDHRPLARMGADQPHASLIQFAEEQPDPDREGQARRGAVLVWTPNLLHSSLPRGKILEEPCRRARTRWSGSARSRPVDAPDKVDRRSPIEFERGDAVGDQRCERLSPAALLTKSERARQARTGSAVWTWSRTASSA